MRFHFLTPAGWIPLTIKIGTAVQNGLTGTQTDQTGLSDRFVGAVRPVFAM